MSQFPARERAAKYVLTNCTAKCSINPRNLPGQIGDLIHQWYEAGDSNAMIMEKLRIMGGPRLSNGALGRHRKNHMTRADQLVDPSQAPLPEKRTDLEVLEIIIGRGGQQVDLATSKVTTDQLLKAIDLKHKLTEGSVFDALFGALVEEGDEAFEGGPESPEAVASSEEAAQALPVEE